jgi:cytoskeletal protein CcmA (bactofilin family)
MFSSKVKETVPAPQVQGPAAPAMQQQPKRPLRTDHAPSIISGDLTVNGTLTSAGDMQVDGRVEGDIRSNGLVIGEKAEIHGEIFAEDLTVRGKVVGRIRARKVLLCSTSHVEGDILHEAFAVEAGAFFEGNIRHSDNPLADAAPVRKPVPQPAVVLQTAPQAVAMAPQPVPMPPPPPTVSIPPTVTSRAISPVATLAPLGSSAN